MDGSILWANAAFCEWSEYTLSELTKMTWIQLSVSDDNLDADFEMAKTLDLYNLSYTVQKRYIPKNGKPQIGNLHVTRYPASGDIKFCFCRWEPLGNGTAQAFELALASQKKVVDKMNELTTEVKEVTKRSEGEWLLLSLVRMGVKYPKIVVAVAVFILGAFGAEMTISTLQKLGFLPPPAVTVQEKQP